MASYKITVLGDNAVGKTALTTQLTCSYFMKSYDPTIEDLFQKQILIDQEDCKLEILDTAGVGFQHYESWQDYETLQNYEALQDSWIKNGEGFILVYSISSRSSFSRVLSLYDKIRRLKQCCEPIGSTTSSLFPQCVPIVLVGNKCDSIDRQVSIQQGYALAREIGCPFVETSAKSYESVQTAFCEIVRLLRRLYNAKGKPAQLSSESKEPCLKPQRHQYSKKRPQLRALLVWAKNCYSRKTIWKRKYSGKSKKLESNLSRLDPRVLESLARPSVG